MLYVIATVWYSDCLICVLDKFHRVPLAFLNHPGNSDTTETNKIHFNKPLSDIYFVVATLSFQHIKIISVSRLLFVLLLIPSKHEVLFLFYYCLNESFSQLAMVLHSHSPVCWHCPLWKQRSSDHHRGVNINHWALLPVCKAREAQCVVFFFKKPLISDCTRGEASYWVGLSSSSVVKSMWRTPSAGACLVLENDGPWLSCAGEHWRKEWRWRAFLGFVCWTCTC